MKHKASASSSGFLQKQNNQGGLDHNRSIAPNQGRQGVLPVSGVNNTSMASLNNTKAPMTRTVPQGKPHAKVVGAPKNMQHGRYL